VSTAVFFEGVGASWRVSAWRGQRLCFLLGLSLLSGRVFLMESSRFGLLAGPPFSFLGEGKHCCYFFAFFFWMRSCIWVLILVVAASCHVLWCSSHDGSRFMCFSRRLLSSLAAGPAFSAFLGQGILWDAG